MAAQSALARLSDIPEAIENILTLTKNVSLDQFEADWQKRWIVERGIEIISEASRRLPGDLKQRHPEIPWPRVASIGNVLRHEYERIAPAILWKLAQDELQPLEQACRTELQQLKNQTS
jgi:uncharacterized protein with HEPN domain